MTHVWGCSSHFIIKVVVAMPTEDEIAIPVAHTVINLSFVSEYSIFGKIVHFKYSNIIKPTTIIL